MIESSQPPFCQTDVTGSTVNLRVLNLYCGIGGNRKLWQNVDVTAVEYNEEIASIYKEYYPNDTVIVADAHEYLLNNYMNFDFIWSSPPCPSHSRVRFGQANSERENYDPIYPDMALYQEILFLDNYYKGKYVVENVIPFYEPLIPAQKRDRHLYWCNFKLPNDLNGRPQPKGFIDTGSKPNEIFHEIDLATYKGEQRKDKIARNLVDYEAGKTIFSVAMGIIQKPKTKQESLFGNEW